MRENALLRALGADAWTLRGILSTEYLVLGSLAGLAGVGLATLSSWALLKWVFELPFTAPVGVLAAIWISAVAITWALGVAGSRAVTHPRPLAAIRSAEAIG